MQTRAKNIGIVGMEALLFCCVYGCYVCSTSGKRSDQSFAGRTKRLATVLLPSYFVVYFSLRRRLKLTNRGRWRQKNQRGLELLQGLSKAYASARLLYTKSELPLECLSGSSSFAVTHTYASYYIYTKTSTCKTGLILKGRKAKRRRKGDFSATGYSLDRQHVWSQSQSFSRVGLAAT